MNSSKLFFIVVFAPISFNIETFLLLDLDLDWKRMCDAEDSVCLQEHKDSHPSRVSFLFSIWDQNPNVLDQNRFVRSIYLL